MSPRLHEPAHGLLLVLSAPSGAGKTTLARQLVETVPGACFSVSYTTRAPRGAERDGVDYHFVSAERFAALESAGTFLESAEVHGHRYGTARAPVERALADRRVMVFDIDVQGGHAIRDAFPRDTVAVWILPPSFEELERRLRARGTDDAAAVARRLAAARQEVREGGDYDYFVVNEDLAAAFEDLRAIVRASLLSPSHQDLARFGV